MDIYILLITSRKFHGLDSLLLRVNEVGTFTTLVMLLRIQKIILLEMPWP